MYVQMSAPTHEMLEKLKIDCKEYLVNKAIVLFKVCKFNVYIMKNQRARA